MKDAIEGGAKAAETGAKAVGQGAKAVSNAANTANKTADVASDASSAAQKLPKSKNSVSNLSSEGNSSDSSTLKNATSKRNPETLGKSTDSNAGKEDSAKEALEKSKENRGRKENKYSKAQERLDDISDRIENSKEEVPDTEVGEDDAGSNFAKDTAKKAGNAAKTVASDAVGSAADVAGIAGGIATGNYVGAVFSGLSLLGRLAKYYILYFIVTLFVMIISIALIIYGVYGPLLEAMQKFDEIANRVTDTLEKGNNLYTGFGYQSTKDAFYEELQYLYNEYDKQINVPLLMSTLFYTEMFNGYSSDFNVDLIGDDSGDISELEGPALKGAIVMYLETKYNDVYSTLDEDGKNYTVGKIYRLRKLARHQLDTSLFGSNLPTTSEEITLKDFVERSKSRLSDDAYQYLQTIASVTNPFINATNAIKGLYDMIKGTEICETTSICNPTENELAFQNLIKELVMTSSSVSSLRYSITDGVFYVTVYKYKANEDNYKKYLKEYYIPKMPEFKDYIGNATGDEKDKIIDNIINNIYTNMKDFADIFGYDLDADSEGYEDSCVGGIETELANSDKLGLPVKVADGMTPTFDGDYAFGLRDGKNHNGIDINAATTGSKEGDPVYAIADGEVIDSKPAVSCNSRKDKDCPTTGAWVRIKHTITIEKNTYNFISVYMHMQANSGQPAVGTKVEKGQVIGHIGNTGDSSGPHLHFEFRKDNGTPVDPVNLFIKCTGNSELVGDTPKENAWWYLLGLGYTKEGAAGIMGNWSVESGFQANNLENACEKGGKGGTIYTDESITAAIDSGKLGRDKFIASTDVCTIYSGGRYGYGLAQWTATSRKAGLYDFWKQSGSSSIADLKMQLDYYKHEVSNMSGLENYLKSATSPEDSASVFFKEYEIGTAGEIRRTRAREIYNELKDKERPKSDSNITPESPVSSRIMQKAGEIKTKIATGGYKYRGDVTKQIPSDNIKEVDCSSYVSWVLYAAGVRGFTAGNQATSSTFNNNPWNFNTVSREEAQAGDILVYNGHVEIYAGNNTCYNAGSDNIIKINGTSSCSWNSMAITKILRVN